MEEKSRDELELALERAIKANQDLVIANRRLGKLVKELRATIDGLVRKDHMKGGLGR